MSEHSFAYNNEIGELELIEDIAVAVRRPDYMRREAGQIVFGFSPDLSPSEATVLQACVEDSISARKTRDLSVTYQEYLTIKADLGRLKTYATTNNPTNAQTVAAMKSVIAVLRAMLKG